MLGEIHSAVDFREVLLWQEAGTKEDRLVEEARKTLDKDDVINLQFTRSFSFYQTRRSPHTEFILKWDNWCPKGCLCDFGFAS
jgi:hypothetical protein